MTSVTSSVTGCPTCTFENTDGTQDCEVCGTHLLANLDSRIPCPMCTFKNVDGLADCEMCGAAIIVDTAHWESLQALGHWGRQKEQEQKDADFAATFVIEPNRTTRRLARAASLAAPTSISSAAASASSAASSFAAASASNSTAPIDCVPHADLLMLLLPHFAPSTYRHLARAAMLNQTWRLASEAWLASATAVAMTSPRVRDTDLLRVATHCARLFSLNLSGCAGLTDGGTQQLVERQPQLQQLDLSGCSGLGDDTVMLLAQRLSRLQRLNLSHCGPRVYSVTEAMAALGQCKHLESLDLRGGGATIFREGLLALLSGPCRLKELRTPEPAWKARTMDPAWFGMRDVALLARLQPELEHLEHEVVEFTPSLVRAVRELLDWPQLKSLTFPQPVGQLQEWAEVLAQAQGNRPDLTIAMF